MALSYYKIVAERGAWGDDPLRDGEELWKIGTERAKQDAILRWMIAAERGFEAAQNNIAYIFDQGSFLLACSYSIYVSSELRSVPWFLTTR